MICTNEKLAVIEIGYKRFVMEPNDAAAILSLISCAAEVETDYITGKGTTYKEVRTTNDSFKTQLIESGQFEPLPDEGDSDGKEAEGSEI